MTTVEWKMQIYAPTAFPHFWDFSGIFLGFCGIQLGYLWNVDLDGPKVGFLWDFYGIFLEFYGNKVGNLWNVDLDDPKVGFFCGIFMGLIWDCCRIIMG